MASNVHVCCSILAGGEVVGKLGTAAASKEVRQLYGAAGKSQKANEEEETEGSEDVKEEEEEEQLSNHSLFGSMLNVTQQHEATHIIPD